MKKEKKIFIVQGTGKFAHIIGKTVAVSEKQAIKNVAYSRGIIRTDQYGYFKSEAIVQIEENHSV